MNVAEILNDLCKYLSNHHEFLKRSKLVTSEMEESFAAYLKKMILFGIYEEPAIPTEQDNSTKIYEIDEVNTNNRINERKIIYLKDQLGLTVKKRNEDTFQQKNTEREMLVRSKERNTQRFPANNVQFESVVDELSTEEIFDMGNQVNKKPKSAATKTVVAQDLGIQKKVAVTNVQNVNTEKKNVKGPKYIQCELCNKKFRLQSVFKFHMRVHLGEKPYKCPTCQTGFTMKCNLTRHLRTGCKRKSFKCLICFKKFSTQADVKSHMSLHTKSKNKDSVNKNASEVVESSNANPVVVIKKTFKMARNYECNKCNKIYSNRKSLYRHKKCHINLTDGKVRCKKCEKVFSSRSNLGKHMKKHSDIRDFQCSKCKLSFISNSAFKQHNTELHAGKIAKNSNSENTSRPTAVKTGQNVKGFSVNVVSRLPFSCTYCNKTFKRYRQMEQHRFIHTGEKPYKCKICFRPFRQKSNLYRHMINIHETRSRSLPGNTN